jgi:putative peptide zinc metalloprotease protein
MGILLAMGLPRLMPTAYADTTIPAGGGGGDNIVQVINQADNQLRVAGHIQLDRIPGPNAQPVNLADAVSTCTNCQTLAVALQVALISTSAQIVIPQNAAVAVNANCTHCTTVALAYQYDISVSDPTQVPSEVNQLMAQLKQELAAIQSDPTLTLDEALARVQVVIAQYQDLANSLSVKQDEATS